MFWRPVVAIFVIGLENMLCLDLPTVYCLEEGLQVNRLWLISVLAVTSQAI